MTSSFRTLAVTLALGAMLLRAVLPAGWMPNIAGSTDAPLVICSLDGVHHVLPAHDPSQGSQDDHGLACPFAAAAHLAPPQAPLMVLQPHSTSPLELRFAEAAQAPSPHDPGHAPRGPPVSI